MNIKPFDVVVINGGDMGVVLGRAPWRGYLGIYIPDELDKFHFAIVPVSDVSRPPKRYRIKVPLEVRKELSSAWKIVKSGLSKSAMM